MNISMINGNKGFCLARLKTLVVLVFCGNFLFLSLEARAFSGGTHGDASHSYRDSLLRRISTIGSLSMDCRLSYPIGSAVPDPSFGDNAREFSALREFLRLSLGDTLLVVRDVSLTGYCSPDGTVWLNERLAVDRTRLLHQYLCDRDPVFVQYPARVSSRGADWTGLRRLIAASGYSWSGEALRIIDSDVSPERKKLYLAALDGGRAHQIIYDLYPLLRRVEVKVTYDVPAMRRQGTLPPDIPASADFKSAENRGSAIDRQYCDTLIYLVDKSADCVEREPLFALKTNLLFDAALAPNVELELPLGRSWSVMVEYTFPWWLHRGDIFCMEMLQGGVEGRYWPGHKKRLPDGSRRRLLTGWFVGGYTSGGYYDFQFKRDKGYQGEFFIAAGVSGGYSCRLVRGLNMEFSLGVGALSTKYRQYEVVRGAERTELVRQNAGKFFWLGPTKAKISLVWLVGEGRKKR